MGARPGKGAPPTQQRHGPLSEEFNHGEMERLCSAVDASLHAASERQQDLDAY